jgi:hypothetical protein
MPAFSLGLKYNAHDPYGFTRFLDALSSGRHAAYYDNPSEALGGGGIEEGNAILGHLFGSKELSRAIAAQAAQATGISQSIMKSMLPTLAPMIMGGLFKQLSEASTGAANPMLNNPLGKMFEQMAGGAMGGGAMANNTWGKMFEEMMGGAQGGGLGSANPWGRMFEQMMGGGTAAAEPKAPPEPEAPPEEEPHEEEPGGGGGLGDLFGEMFETGRSMQRDYQKNMESIFDQFLQGMKQR